MKISLLIPCWLALLLGLSAGTALAQTASAPTPSLIPLPRTVNWQNGGVSLARVVVELPSQETFLRAETERVLRENGVALDARAPLRIRFRRAPVAGAPQGNAEAYALNIAADGIEISAPETKGWLLGWQTLRQMLQKRGATTWVRAAKIADWPAYRWRGFMHDVGRNPQDVATLKRFVDLMARYKLNVFHLHLSDYPGYRVENHAYPQLNAAQFQDKTRRPGFFYSYSELRDLIAYCRERGIEVVPEIDMPGHSNYFQRAFGFAMQDPRGLEIMKKVIDEFLDEIQTPYFHMGADEVSITNPQFIDEMADFIRARGRKLLVWRPGNLPSKGEYIVHRWPNGAQDNSAPPGIAQVDSRHNYINHMDALIAPIRMLTLQPGDVPQSTPTVLGPILAHWPDANVGEEINIYRHSPVLPALLGGADRFWRGGDKVEWKHVAIFPLPSDAFYQTYQEFENRLVAHRDALGAQWPFRYVKNAAQPWKVLGPIPNDDNPAQIFAPEQQILPSYEIAGKTYTWSEARGGTIHINHFFDYPGWLPSAKTGTAYAYTRVWSPRAQSVGFWIGFNAYSQSSRRGGPNPDVGQWSNTGSKIWLNGKTIEPPLWKQPNLSANSNEVPFVDEDYFYREPTPVALQAGWNLIFVKAPRNGPAWKWMFTCVPVKIVDGVPREVEALKFATEIP